MKRICWLLIITLLLGCLAACQSAGTQAYGDELTQSQKEEIEKAYLKINRDGMLWYDETNQAGTKYLGSENGYAFLFVHGAFCMPWKYEIAGYLFEFSSCFILYAYKGGEFYNLEDVYNDGLISVDGIKAAHVAFTAHRNEFFGVTSDE